VEALERRAFFLLLAVAIVLAFDRGDFTSTTGKGWEVVVYIVGLLFLALAATLLVVAIAPQAVTELPKERRESLLFVAFALTVAAMLAMVLLRAYGTYYLHKHGFPG